MSLLLKISLFIVFLIALIAWVAAASYLLKKYPKDLLRGKTFLTNELVQFHTFFALFGFVWLLSGFLSIKLIILFILCSHIGVIITGILWRLMGTTNLPWAASGMWTGSELGVKHPWMLLVVIIVSTLIYVAYPIMSGICYFNNPIPSPEVTILIFRYTLIAMYVSGFICMLPMAVSMLSSKNLDEGTRLRLLINQGGGLISIALIIALIFWAFGITGKGYNFAVSGIPLTISPILVFVILGYFICTILLPYFIGTQQAKKWRINLLGKQKGWVGKLLEVLEFPTPSQYHPKLEHLQNDLVSEEEQLIENDAMVKLGMEIEDMQSLDSLPLEQRNLIEAYKDSRDLEPRFTYLDFIRHLKKKVGEIVAELAKLENDVDKVDRAKAFSQSYHYQKDDLTKSIEVESKAKLFKNVALVGIASAVITPLLNELSKWIWTTFMQTLN